MSAFDYTVIALYGTLVLAIGLRVGRGHGSSQDLLLAKRSLPTWAVLCSMVATELSAATFIGVPHAAYVGDWGYLQLAFGALLGKLAVATVVIPLYHRLGLVTVYGLLEDRFGPLSRRAAAAAFVAGRIMASGVRLFIAALAFAAVSGQPIESAIAISGVAAGAYTLAGGIRSVVWTDVVQGFVFMLGAGTLLVALNAGAEGGLGEILRWADAEQRSRVFHWTPWLSLSSARPFAVGVIGGFFLTLATHSTDHDMVQRLLTTRDGASGGRALLGSALLNFPLSVLFLFIGSAIAFHTSAMPPAYDISDTARILPTFALHELPSGARGLVFAGLFAAAMSSLDSAICAIATTWVVDLAPHPDTELDLSRRIRIAAATTTVLLIAAALAMAAYQRALAAASNGAPALNLVELALSSMTILYGGLLGVFAVAVLGRGAGSDRAAVAGLVAGCTVGFALFLHPLILGEIWIAWTWWIPIGAAIAACITLLGGRARREISG
jgi:SSS family solute:Na+ symporter